MEVYKIKPDEKRATEVATWSPYHSADDKTKVATIKASIEAEGWDWEQPPLVVWGEQLVTGAHRSEAIRQLVEEGHDFPVDTLELSEIFAYHDLDFDELWEEYGQPTSSDPAFIRLVQKLPVAVRNHYAIDID